MEGLYLGDFKIFKMDENRTECRADKLLGNYFEPKKNLKKQLI